MLGRSQASGAIAAMRSDVWMLWVPKFPSLALFLQLTTSSLSITALFPIAGCIIHWVGEKFRIQKAGT